MTASVTELILPQAERALAEWLPNQRWFDGKGRDVVRVESRSVTEFTDQGGPVGLLVVADVHFADGTQRYLLPLGLRRIGTEYPGTALVTTTGGFAVYDATTDQELVAELLHLIGTNSERGGVRFAAEPHSGLAFVRRQGLSSHPQEAEQSNTSVVIGNRFILKLFRRMPTGTNPDLELHRALTRTGSRHIAQLLGAIETELDGATVTMATLHSFYAGAHDGWQVATAEVGEVVSSGADGGRFAAEAKLLGNAVAAVHTDLAAELGITQLSKEDICAGMLDRLDYALGEVPALEPYASALREVFTATTELAPGEFSQRVHGDLHLGQVLRTPTRWLLIDFEGEPSAALAERIAPHSPLRDVAGMLRSFDYAANYPLHSGRPDLCADAESRAAAWTAHVSDAFCQGYAQVAGQDPRERGPLLAAYELDKAIYEVVYERRNRPDWIDIPLRAVHRLLGQAPT